MNAKCHVANLARRHNPAATQADLDTANHKIPPSEIIHETRTAKGTVKTLPKPKTQLFRTQAEGRVKGVMPTRCKKIKLTSQFWTAKQLSVFFYQISYIANRDEHGWFIHLNSPHRKLTQDDQLHLMIQAHATVHLVQINKDHKHLIIQSLEGGE